MLFIAASSCVKQRRATSCPFPESTASGGSCLAWTSPGLHPRPWRRPSASGRAVSPSVTCRPWFPPFGRRHGNASVRRRSGQVGVRVLAIAALNRCLLSFIEAGRSAAPRALVVGRSATPPFSRELGPLPCPAEPQLALRSSRVVSEEGDEKDGTQCTEAAALPRGEGRLRRDPEGRQPAEEIGGRDSSQPPQGRATDRSRRPGADP